MSKITWKGGALLAPVPPAMITCGTMEQSNIVTVAWTGIVNTHPPMTYISLRPTRHSYGIIKESGEFVINLTTKELIRAADYCGMYTGRKVDKFAKCALTREQASAVACPILAQSPLALECRVKQILPLGTHEMFLSEIVAVSVEESLLDADGRLCLSRAGLAAFAHGEYFALGNKIGTFGFSVRKRKR